MTTKEQENKEKCYLLKGYKHVEDCEKYKV